VITSGHEMAQTFKPTSDHPRCVVVSVSALGPRSRGDAMMEYGGIVLHLQGGHYNAMVPVPSQ